MDKIKYTIQKSARAKHLRLEVYQKGEIKLVVPESVSKERAFVFLKSKYDWLRKKLAYFKTLKGGRCRRYRRRPLRGRKDYLKHKERARKLVLERLEYFNTQYNFKYNRVSIKNHKRRWGSCSKAGNLNFNYRIVLLPERLSDYIIVHELCHLKELNHKPEFWRLVERACPSYKQLRSELKSGASLIRRGA
jgi:predicted metal-dependent hydrolase